MLKLFRLVWLLGSLLFFSVACSNAPEDQSSEEPASEELTKEPSQEPTVKTSGKLRLIGVPSEGMTACEVILVSELEPEARQRIERQRELLEQKISGEAPSDSKDDAYGMRQEDYLNLRSQLTKLKQSFPEGQVRAFSMKSQNGRSLKFASDVDLQKEYKDLFDAITFDNLGRALVFIKDKLSVDNKQQLAEAAQADEAAQNQNRVTLDWLEELAKLLNQYIALHNEVIAAKNTFADAQDKAAEQNQEPQDWDAYSAYYRYILLVDVSQYSIGSDMVGSDGLFEIEGEGELIVRVEYAPKSAYFIVGEDEARVRIDPTQP